ncbi:MAG TPA: hypothetical protein VKP30_22325 [Polyangiaceae bacterium]|nr:hypothetical protein [Polyangiaceae bacterium]
MKLNFPDGTQPTPRRRWKQTILAFTTLGFAFVGCVYDADQRCGPGMVLEKDGSESCVCATGYAPTPTGCVACGAHETAGPTGCVCETGYSKASPTEPCTAAPAGLGTPCDASTNPCVDATFNHCHVVSGTAGYCTTQGCTSTAECTGGYMCELTAPPAYCRRPPVGAGTPCDSDAKCAGTEATYCDTSQSKTCVVQGCTLTPDNCFTGTECCDLSIYGLKLPLCVPTGACST